MLKFYFRIYNHAAFTWPDDNDFIYSIKFAHVQVVINSRYSVAQMCTCEDALAYILGTPSIGDIMSYISLTTKCFLSRSHIFRCAVKKLKKMLKSERELTSKTKWPKLWSEPATSARDRMSNRFVKSQKKTLKMSRPMYSRH